MKTKMKTLIRSSKAVGLIAMMSIALTGCIVPGGGEEPAPRGTTEPGNNQTANNQQANNQSTNNTSNTSSNNQSTNNTSTGGNNGSNTTANNTSSNTTTVEPSERTVLRGTYISGHLGSYWDCPGEGYTGEDAMMTDGAEMDGFAEGDCAEDSCGFLNCQDAQMTILLNNDGALVAEEISISKIRLLDLDDRELGILPLIAIHNTAHDGPFSGTLDAGAQVQLRIDFLGPENLQKLKDDAMSGDNDGISNDGDRAAHSGALIEITFTSKNADDEVVVSKELYDLPAVDT